MEKGNEELWRDILQRLTKIEENTKGLDEVSKKANAAHAMAESNREDIIELKEAQKGNRTWLMGLLATVVGYVIMNYLLR